MLNINVTEQCKRQANNTRVTFQVISRNKVAMPWHKNKTIKEEKHKTICSLKTEQHEPFQKWGRAQVLRNDLNIPFHLWYSSCCSC